MSDSRYNVLAAVARGVRTGPVPPGASLDHPGLAPPLDRPGDREGMIASFTRELDKLMGIVHRVATDAEAQARVLDLLNARGVGRVLAWDDPWLRPAGLGDALRSAGIAVEPCWLPTDGPDRTARLKALDDVVVGITGAYGALADTGSLVVVSGPGRGRIASLLPPIHIAVIGAEQLAPTLAAFFAANADVADVGSNTVVITGPSRTGDIEGTLVLGVHGPGELHVIVVG